MQKCHELSLGVQNTIVGLTIFADFSNFVSMNETLVFRKALPDDAGPIQKIIRQAQARMRKAGSRQWQDGYPAATHIASDIACGEGYVLCNPAVIAYGAVIFGGEPAYAEIEGQWPSDEPYVVVHRLAVAESHLSRGMATEFMHRAEALARQAGIGTFRIDTACGNAAMLHLLGREGFVYCGKIRYASGERLAYWKRLE